MLWKPQWNKSYSTIKFENNQNFYKESSGFTDPKVVL